MVPRELIVLATLTLALSVATSSAAAAVAASSSSSSSLAAALAAAASASIDFDLNTHGAGGDGNSADYELLADNDERMLGHEIADDLNDSRATSTQNQQHQHQRLSTSSSSREVRCYCNQPHCVSQGYMCRGRGCFTELPALPPASSAAHHHQQHLQQHHQQLVVAAYSGCLERSFAEKPCPRGKLCCEQDLCNHVDSPAMRSRLNKTLQVLLGEHRTYFGAAMHPVPGQEATQSTADGWFRTATIAVPICGFVVILVLASLAIRLLQPLPSQGDKLHGLGMHLPENHAPPLLGRPSINKLPLV